MMSTFIWDGSYERKKDNLINWQVVSKSKCKGGLFAENLVAKNVVFVGM